MTNRNKFGSIKWENSGEEAALNAGVFRMITLGTKAQLENYAPFVRFVFENNSDERIALYVDGQANSTTGVVAGYKNVLFVEPHSGKEILPYDNGEPDVVFHSITMENKSATNTAAGELAWRVANY